MGVRTKCLGRGRGQTLKKYTCICASSYERRECSVLLQRAQNQGVKLMLDAEYTYLQASMDLIILALQQKYNRRTPFVYNTYQCYRKVKSLFLKPVFH